ncbi:hypothetical protein FA10DRAFT_269937 [Acaromyces ingoldii]|uniref:H-type lectin domain-containing protein n=1 Tax=Acaromyces ingoldii TaxID=215250 RepID=A0A316YDU7_9BASI|nr:hypothetical protein FA10DRAFT_269937 [Acaromyces ingoldii]PWN86838.1 hypothetical protein FA10DRAFT_269937 [Acaromyces ingoldii]
MKMLAEKAGTTSALQRMPGLLDGSSEGESKKATAESGMPRGAVPPPQRQMESAAKEEKPAAREEKPAAREEKPAAREEKPAAKAVDGKEARAAEKKANLDAAASKYAEAKSLSEILAQLEALKAKVDAKTTAGIMDVRAKANEKALAWTPDQARGPAQSVEYQAKFVNKLSEITDDMRISGSLAIKYNGIGGSGSGMFFDAESFYDSDLVYYVSVKVTNQTLCFKDPLSFNPLRSCMADQTRFNDVFGDTFISGFLEGGEFNAIVCVKIHNTAKKRDIEAEAKVALTAGPVEVSAQGNVKLAEENIKNNSQTTIFVRWCGGGNVKPYDDEWTIDTVMAAAARFPALVGLYPQRTYAVLTRYELLRSFRELRPTALSPMRYEVAQLYTGMLLDGFMEYKSLAKRLAADIADVQAGLKVIIQGDDEGGMPLSRTVRDAGLARFSPDILGLDRARSGVRTQMNAIAREIDLLTAQPQLAVDPRRRSPFVGPGSFACLLPRVELKDSRRRTTASPLALKPLAPVETAATQDDKTGEDGAARLFDRRKCPGAILEPEEHASLSELEFLGGDDIGLAYKVSAPVGDVAGGTLFNTLDICQADATVSELVAVCDAASGALASLVVTFHNGLSCTYGRPVTQAQVEGCPREHRLGPIDLDRESVVSVSVQVGELAGASRVVGLEVQISPTKKLSCLAPPSSRTGERVRLHAFANLVKGGCLAGFWGRTDSDAETGDLLRLAPIWARQPVAKASAGKGASGAASSSALDGISRSEWVSMKQAKTISYPKGKRAGPPAQLLYAPHYLKQSAKARENADAASNSSGLTMGAAISEVTSQGFLLATQTRAEEDAQFTQWMVPAEIESVLVNCGLEAFAASSNAQPFSREERRVVFPASHAKDEPVDVQCYFAGIKARSLSPDGAVLHLRASVVAGSLTARGFTLLLEAPEGCSPLAIDEARIGWLSHTRSKEKANASIVSGTALFDDLKQPSRSIKLTPSLERDPSARFWGLNEIRAGLAKPISFTTSVLPSSSKSQLDLEAGNLGSDVSLLGLSWILCA